MVFASLMRVAQVQAVLPESNEKPAAAKPRPPSSHRAISQVMNATFVNETSDDSANNESTPTCGWHKEVRREIKTAKASNLPTEVEATLAAKTRLTLTLNKRETGCGGDSTSEYAGAIRFVIENSATGEVYRFRDVALSLKACGGVVTNQLPAPMLPGDCRQVNSKDIGTADEGTWEVFDNGKILNLRYDNGTKRVYLRQ